MTQKPGTKKPTKKPAAGTKKPTKKPAAGSKKPTKKPAAGGGGGGAKQGPNTVNGVKMHPLIKSRILPGYNYPANYPNFNVAGPRANSSLPADMLDKPLTFKHPAKGFLSVVKNGAVYNNGQNDSQAWKPATTATAEKWIVRKAKTGDGYTVELAVPKNGLKYLATPDVCFTPLNNPEAAAKDEPWPIGRTLGDGSTAPYKYPVQGQEWSLPQFKNKSPCPANKDCSRNGMFGTPKWWPTARLISTPDPLYAVWHIEYNRGTKATGFSSAKRPHNCGTRLDVFPVAKDKYWDLVRLTHAGTFFTASYNPAQRPVAPTKDKPTKPAVTASHLPEPVVTTSGPYTMQPLSLRSNTNARMGNNEIGMDINNESQNQNNIANMGGDSGDGGGGGGDATTALLMASLMGQQATQQQQQAANPVYPYPNPYAMPPGYMDPNTLVPSPTPDPASTIPPTLDPNLALLQQLMTTPVPTLAPVPWYKSTTFLISAGLLLLALAGLGAWWYFGKSKSNNRGDGNNAERYVVA